MPKNPMILDRVILKNGGTIETEEGTDIISVDSSGDATVASATETIVDLTTTGDTIIGDASGDSLTVNATSTISAPLTVGVDDTGHDVKFFGATASSYLLWDESDDKLKVVGVLDIEDTGSTAASGGSIIKKQLQASVAYTGTTAGLMVKNYGDAAATVPSGEFTGLYVNLKGLHTDPGNNTSLISAHVHGDNTTTVHAGLWLYGDMTNGVKMSGSTLTSLIDGSEVTAVSNLANLKAATDGAVEASVAEPAGNTTHCMRILIDGTTPGYIPVYAAKTF